MNLTRRKFFVGLGIAAAAPAIVRVASIMPVSAPRLIEFKCGQSERMVFYCNPTFRKYLNLAAMKNTNFLIKHFDDSNPPHLEFMGVPLRAVEYLS